MPQTERLNHSKSDDEDTAELHRLLRGVPIFYRLGDDSLKVLLEIGRRVTFPSQTIIITEGGSGSELHLILRGLVSVRKKGKEIARLGRGQFFGEMAFLDDLPARRTADVFSIEETDCLEIPGSSWYTYLRQNPDAAIEVIRTLAHRLREANEARAD